MSLTAPNVPGWITDNLEGIFSAAAVGVIGAVIAGVSAWVKTWFVSRDDKTRAADELELASKRTRFVVQWMAAKRTIEEDETSPADVKARAQAELDTAYQNAQRGFAEGRSALQDASYEQVVDQLRRIVLLRRGLRTTSKLFVAFFYLCVFGLAAVLGVQQDVPCRITVTEAPQSEPTVEEGSPETNTLQVTIDGPPRVVSGKEVTYAIRVSNTGDSPLAGGTVTGNFPLGSVEEVTANAVSEDAEQTELVNVDSEQIKWKGQEFPSSSAKAFSVTAEVVAGKGVELEFLATVEVGDDSSVTGAATARTSVIAPCVAYRFVPSGWAWFFGAVAGTAVLRLLFGWLVAWNEGRRRTVQGHGDD